MADAENTVEADWKAVCDVEDIPRLGARRVARDHAIPVAVFRTGDDKLFALLDRCPHRGGPLSQGIVFGSSVACPLHNWTIGLDDGHARGEDKGCTPSFRCKVDDGRVYLDRTELSTLGLDLQPPKAGPGASTGALGDNSFEVQAPHTA